MATNGADIVISVETPAGSGVYTAIGSQRNATITEETAMIDVSSKDGRAQRVLGGRYSCTVTCEALYVPTDAAMAALKTAIRAGTLVTIRKVASGVAQEEADALITSKADSFPDQGESVVSVELTLDGEWSAV